ncbi:fibronectin type III domain-containing protein [Dyadobacter sp. CY326]|uniref:fibronectin type III domain-containing protein n=1 Tax=Dyadobacter sp. CY326 TaxID=2907300 RepID=UPI001F16D26B|nr:fibronectin type III domain-containing protein [Dyadobacter sp. CY326]MCE7065985.1 fibronectin type III domain-containing protein [Dyadobacter sp. CY326]
MNFDFIKYIFFFLISITQLAAQVVVVPKAPAALTATAVSATQINLTWTDNATNETGFELERSLDGLKFVKIADVAANVKTFQNTGLAASTKYWFRILAKNTAAKSAYSNIASATTLLLAPVAPENLTATAVSISQINLTWADASNNESGFQLERSLDGKTFSKIADLAANAVTFQNTGLAPATDYFYRIRAINAAGNSPYSDIVSAKTQNIPVPDRPENFTAVPIAPDLVQLRWSPVSANTKEVIIERSAGDNQYVQIGKVAANVLQFQDTDSLARIDHYYRIKAVNAGGSSPYSLVSIVLANSIITGVEPVADKHLVYVFDKTIFTELSRSSAALLQIYDLRGVQLREENIGAFSQTNISSLSAGIYIVRIVTDKEVISRKIALY